jgi:hypothetical protein
MTLNKKRLGINLSVMIIIVFSLLLFVSFASAAEKIEIYNSSHPIINVNYYERPITITGFNLTDSNNIMWGIFPKDDMQTFGLMEYNFTVNYLSPGNYAFLITGKDPDDNIVTATKNFIINFSSMRVELQDPIPAIGKTSKFNLTVKSQYNATCRYGYSIPDCSDATNVLYESCIFDRMPESFDQTTNVVIHKKLPFEAPFNDGPLHVICRINAPGANYNATSSYGMTDFMTGYDTTAPIITSVTAVPNPVEDKYSKNTFITVATNEPTVCTIEGGVGSEYINKVFNDANPLIYYNYTLEHNITVGYYGVTDNDVHDFKYNITCMNRAKLSDKKDLTVRVNFNSSIIITKITPDFVSTSPISFELKTNIGANCSLRKNSSSDWNTMTSTTHRTMHNYNVAMILGKNSIQVKCDAGPQTKSANYNIVFDNSPPTLDLKVNVASCSLEEFGVYLNASDAGSGIDTISYRLTDSDDVEVIPWKNVSNPDDNYITIQNLDLNDGEEYTFEAYTTDNSGIESESRSSSFTATGPDNIHCDFAKPTITLNISVVSDYEKSVKVACYDGSGSGCQNTFNYNFASYINGSCNNVSYSKQSTLNTPIQLTDDVLFCAIVYDNNNNNATVSKSISVSTIECGNDVADPGEDCDGENLRGFTCNTFDDFNGGILACYPKVNSQGKTGCTWDTTNCQIGNAGYCGDNTTNYYHHEQCDGDRIRGDWGTISTLPNEGCKQFNFSGGTLSCTPYTLPDGERCMFDTRQCYMNHENPNPKCDGNAWTSTTLLDPGEQCEPKLFNKTSLSCTSIDRFLTGDLKCLNDCELDITNCSGQPAPVAYCGDGITGLGETCDPVNSTRSCDSFTNYTGGLAKCEEGCRINMSQCTILPKCGNNVREGNKEYCDGTDLGGTSCTDLGNYTGGTLRCWPDPTDPVKGCTFDTTNCQVSNYGYCGDGRISNALHEQCDWFAWGQISQDPDLGCQQFGFNGGTLGCFGPYTAKQCMFDTSKCIANSSLHNCGDTILQAGEQCEKTRTTPMECSDFDSYTNGTLTCNTNTCMLDISKCKITKPVCGDEKIQVGETCDGSNFGEFTDCSSIPGRDLTGPLACYPAGSQQNCTFDLSQCAETTIEEYCGDGILNDFDNEKCDIGTNNIKCEDFGYAGGTLSCYDAESADKCTFDTHLCQSADGAGVCGNGVINNNEECEPGKPITVSCEDIGYIGGSTTCNAKGTPQQCKINISQCVSPTDKGICGDNYVRKGNESCDRTNLGGLNCTYFDHFVGGELACNLKCGWDTTNCDSGSGYCGNNIIDNPFKEQCDGTDFGKVESCADFGFDGGTLGCYEPADGQRCTFDTSKCTTLAGTGPCGDTVLNKGEQCEKDRPFDLGCADFDQFIGGAIACDYSTCKYYIGECTLPTVSVCGDGFISGKEECEGLNLGGTTLCTDLSDDFASGSLSCNPSTSRNACQYDISECESKPHVSVCGNGKVEDGEMCDGSHMFLTCEDFTLGEGFLSCEDDCTANTTSCGDGTAVIVEDCGNGITEPGETCDGTMDNPFEESFVELYKCDYGIECTNTCTIDCLTQVLVNTCDNLVKDGDETGFNCGGSCPACDAGESCVLNSDCTSGKCVDNVCQEDPCANGVLDGDETGTDCGGSCYACGAGEDCIIDDDCQSGSCVDGLCVESESTPEKKSNPLGLGFIIAGALLMLGGGGYVIYEEYFDKSRHAAKSGPTISRMQQQMQPPTMMTDPKILEMQKKKQEEKKQQQLNARKSLLEGFGQESTSTDEDSLEKLKEKKVNKEVLKEAGYIDLTEKNPPENESADVFDKLKKIGDKKKITEDATQQSEKQQSEKQSIEKTASDVSKANVSDVSYSTGSIVGRRPKILKVKKNSDTFEKLGDIGKGVSKEDIRSTSSRISELSGKNKSSISRMLNSEMLSKKQVSSMFSNLDKEKLTSDVFKEILSNLVSKGKLSKETLSGMLFEYLDDGTLDRSDVAKIMSQLNMV